MNPLEILKTQLEKALDETNETEDFKHAVEDGLYACDCTVIALEQWISSWSDYLEVNPIYTEEDKSYLRGVKFVEEKWHQITGMF